jgi:hypothetical protein
MTKHLLATPQLIAQVIETGSAFVPNALGVRELESIWHDTRKLNWQLQRSCDDPWLQYEDAKIAPTDPFGAINALRRRWEADIQDLAWRWPCLESYRANDVTVQHYRSPNDGIGTHQDYPIDRLLIAIFTVQGYGPLEIMSARRGGVPVARHDTIPGSLSLLWAPDLPSSTGYRPPHRILRPQNGRISITYRHAVGFAQFKNEKRHIR